MTVSASPIYRLAPGTEVLRLDEDTLVLKGRHASVQLKGSSAATFETRIVPQLDGTATTADIASNVGLGSPDALKALLDDLNQAGLVLRAASGSEQGGTFLDYAEMMGLDRTFVAERIADLKIAIFGLGPLGIDLARHLAQLGVGGLTLCDPFPKHGEVTHRQAFARDACGAGTETTVLVPHADLDEAVVQDVTRQQGFVVSCFGARFAAVDHWVNRAAHAAGIPALFCNVGAGRCVLGPLVFPFETACFTCWQMRTIACADDFRVHMAFAERTAGRSAPTSPPPPEPTYLAGVLAGMAVNEVLKTTLATGRPRLTDAVLEFEPFREGWSEHPVLRRPDCPVCSKKNS